ncbi:hypothetical protein C2845_PM17G02150 [Panicum miliaceum]|uniref:GIR1-like zinc ribbon domain-containing protein n=1 Tax=Panicum miliaceum TaxID=4540 RepID=A0A3L6Q2R3_PANMI|nr:hypothetical protein C2845_PM17G02150 [Panicum miliaceum]
MSNGGRGGARGARPDLQLHLSPPAAGRMEVDGGDSSSSPSSCVSSDGSSPGGKSPMVIGACTRCMMYCMVAKRDFPTCINCKQPSLVDLLHGAGDKRRGKGK